LAVATSALAGLPARAQTPAPVAPPPAQGQPAAQAAAIPPVQKLATSCTRCGLPIPEPANLPPAGSAPVVYQVVPCFQKQGGFPGVEANTYLHYMELSRNVSRPSEKRWVPYDEKIEQIAIADFKRLMATNFLDDLSIEAKDYRFSNGVIGKLIVYDMEERERVKIVDYVGSKKVEMS